MNSRARLQALGSRCASWWAMRSLSFRRFKGATASRVCGAMRKPATDGPTPAIWRSPLGPKLRACHGVSRDNSGSYVGLNRAMAGPIHGTAAWRNLSLRRQLRFNQSMVIGQRTSQLSPNLASPPILAPIANRAGGRRRWRPSKVFLASAGASIAIKCRARSRRLTPVRACRRT